MITKNGRIACKNDGCYQTFRLGAMCPICWEVEE